MPVVFILTGLLAGVAGALFTVNYGDVSPFMGDNVGTKAIAAMVVGGIGSIWGAIAGGLDRRTCRDAFDLFFRRRFRADGGLGTAAGDHHCPATEDCSAAAATGRARCDAAPPTARRPWRCGRP